MRGRTSTSSGSRPMVRRASISSRIFIEPSSAVKELPERPATMIETISTPSSQSQDAHEIDDVIVGAEPAKVKEALLSDDGADQQRDHGDDGHGAHADAVELMSHRGPAKAPGRQQSGAQQHDDAAKQRRQPVSRRERRLHARADPREQPACAHRLRRHATVGQAHVLHQVAETRGQTNQRHAPLAAVAAHQAFEYPGAERVHMRKLGHIDGEVAGDVRVGLVYRRREARGIICRPIARP